MAMKTPSYGIDQNFEGKFVDKYYGRVPSLLHYIPESGIVECNPEYSELLYAVITGLDVESKVSAELYEELVYVVDRMEFLEKERTVKMNYIIACFYEWSDIEHGFPPGWGMNCPPDGHPNSCPLCLPLKVYDPNSETFVLWIEKYSRTFEVSKYRGSCAHDGSNGPQDDCNMLTVENPDSQLPEQVFMRDSMYKLVAEYMSGTPGSCGGPAEFPGENIPDNTDPRCLKLQVIDAEGRYFIPFNDVSGEDVSLSRRAGSCAPLPHYNEGYNNCSIDDCGCYELRVRDSLLTPVELTVVFSDGRYSLGNKVNGCGHADIYAPGYTCDDMVAGCELYSLNVREGYDTEGEERFKVLNFDRVKVHRHNNIVSPPFVMPSPNAGPDITIQLGDDVTLDGSGSMGGTASIVIYRWIEVGTLLSTSISYTYTPTTVGVHTIELVVIDALNNSSIDTMILTVES